jgi:aspartyl-tRNA(Asn)/glutamyl-tRNA(Gln) amidotransferase subunit B
MVKVGLEIHGYILTDEKLFCSCKAIHGAKFAKPNTHICPVCTGQAGAKPMLPNKEALNKALQIALILGCKINKKFAWQRKHYDWPDLPKGYQNTISGSYAIPVGEAGEFLGIRIKEAHLEEDPAAWNPKTGEIDYNRSGSPLIEIVTEPDFSSSEQVIDWLNQLVITLGYIKAIDKNSGIKADVNISLPELHGVRVEVKNVNSLKNIKQVIDYEAKRQASETVKVQETRMFDETSGTTKKMREKESAEDYRFISDPDLPIMAIKSSTIESIKKNLPETPYEKLQKLIKKYNIDKKSAEVLTKKLGIVLFFEGIIEKVNPKLAVPWVTIELLRVLNYSKKEIEEVDIKPEHFIELLKLVENKKITELKAKEILNQFIPSSFSPKQIAGEESRISDRDELEKVCKIVIKENPKAVSDYKAGKKESLNFLIGQVMQKSKKRADFKVVREILEKKLK